MRYCQELRKLVALVRLAYAFCRSVGTRADRKSQPIARKKHGYRAMRLSRHGLNILHQLSRSGTGADEELARMVETLLRFFAGKSLAVNALKK